MSKATKIYSDNIGHNHDAACDAIWNAAYDQGQADQKAIDLAVTADDSTAANAIAEANPTSTQPDADAVHDALAD